MEGNYAQVIVDISHEKVDRPFQYRIPEQLQGKLKIGMCVMVPFGNGNKPVSGYVIGLTDVCNYAPEKIKEILEIHREGAAIEERLITVAAWIKRNYGSTMTQALKTVLPAKRSVKQLEKKQVIRCYNKEETVALMGECGRKHQTAKVRLLKELLETETIPYEWITGKLGVSGQTIRSLEQIGALKIVIAQLYRDPVNLGGDSPTPPKEAHQLSIAQEKIAREILEDYDAGQKPEAYLIHGITGSGKTEVYMKLAEEYIKRGKQVIILIPEISLTYQTLRRFYTRFGSRVSVMNSSLSQGEKYDQCRRAKDREIDIMIGPRSALFTPFPQIGLIVIDEEQETSYKSENTPKYHARETAVEIARLHGASLVLGSATPSLESYYRVGEGDYKLFCLTERLTGGTLPNVTVADMREELRSGNRSIFSRKLQELLADRLEKGEQSMLFLNRRGYAGFISCRSCGYVAKCPHCEVSLSEHEGGKLLCHYCGYSQPRYETCPDCGSKYIMGFRAGTQQIENKIKQMFPKARVLRMDADTTRTKGSYEKILSSFSNGEGDILIGTQMIVKGHDFPEVTLMGILAADLSLGSGDYRASERTFQLLTQAAGRAGRGSKPGEVVIQTYQPDHYAVVYAAAQDYDGFFREEITYREMMDYPPASHLLAVQIFSSTSQDGEEWAAGLAKKVRQSKVCEGSQGEKCVVIGPAPAALSKVNDIFRFVFYIKCPIYDKLIQVKDSLEEELDQNMPKHCQIQFDFDPVRLL
jgi:primosomal protein N' (replication factor Y)